MVVVDYAEPTEPMPQLMGRLDPTLPPPVLPAFLITSEHAELLLTRDRVRVAGTGFEDWHRNTSLLMGAADRLGRACATMYYRVRGSDGLGLAPEITRFRSRNASEPAGPGVEMVDDAGSMHNLLRPETVESLMYLHRASAQAGRRLRYHNDGWHIARSLQYLAKAPYGYTGLKNVRAERLEPDNSMPSYFLSETLKYLYLLFKEEVLPLDQFVFTTEGHPLPVDVHPRGHCKGPL